MICYSRSFNCAMISAPTPCCGHPSSTVTHLPVFLTDDTIVLTSNGLIDLRFMTSTSKPFSLCNLSAAFKHNPTCLPYDINDISSPDLSIFATPIGIKKSLSCASFDNEYDSLYPNSDSNTQTGLLSRIADFNNPLASSQFQGITTYIDIYIYHSKHIYIISYLYHIYITI